LISFAAENFPHRRTANTVLSSQSRIADAKLKVLAAEFCDLHTGELGAAMLRSIHISIAALLDHIACVFSNGSKPQVGGINARGVVAAGAIMQYTEIGRNRAKVEFIREAMGAAHITVRRKVAIAFGVLARQPKPTIIRPAPVYLLPEARRKRMALGMEGIHKADRMPREPSVFSLGLFGDSRPLPTAAFAKAARVGRIDVALGSVVAANELQRLTLNVPKIISVAFGDWGGIAASTLAEFNRGIVRGMIVHVVSSLVAFGHATGRFQSSPWRFVLDLQE
jgi:hypothetical protein